jgi:hypothetical protein
VLFRSVSCRPICRTVAWRSWRGNHPPPGYPPAPPGPLPGHPWPVGGRRVARRLPASTGGLHRSLTARGVGCPPEAAHHKRSRGGPDGDQSARGSSLAGDGPTCLAGHPATQHRRAAVRRCPPRRGRRGWNGLARPAPSVARSRPAHLAGLALTPGRHPGGALGLGTAGLTSRRPCGTSDRGTRRAGPGSAAGGCPAGRPGLALALAEAGATRFTPGRGARRTGARPGDHRHRSGGTRKQASWEVTAGRRAPPPPSEDVTPPRPATDHSTSPSGSPTGWCPSLAEWRRVAPSGAGRCRRGTGSGRPAVTRWEIEAVGAPGRFVGRPWALPRRAPARSAAGGGPGRHSIAPPARGRRVRRRDRARRR